MERTKSAVNIEIIPLICQNLVSILSQGIHGCSSPQYHLNFQCTCARILEYDVLVAYFTDSNAFQNVILFDA